MPGPECCWNADHQDVGQGLERHWGGNGYTPMGLRCHDDGTEVEHHSKAEARSYPSQWHDADCQSDQCIHIEMVTLEGRGLVHARPARLVEAWMAAVFRQG